VFLEPVRVTRRVRAIKADHGAQLRLLDLQGVDSALARLAHRRQTLPVHAELSGLLAESSAIASDLVAADTLVGDLERDQNRAESDLEPVRQRLDRNQHRIADGTISDSKALSSMVDEVAHLKRRIGDLEDAELEVMEQLETALATRDELRGRLAAIDERVNATTAERDRQLAELDAEAAGQQQERLEILPAIPADLIALYVKVGASHGGVGAAELRAGRCTGCQLEINGADLRGFAAAPVNEVLRCEECSRILVRTARSGL
jgi:predicted  nucleic acid-binding Zn-ribbon protein